MRVRRKPKRNDDIGISFCSERLSGMCDRARLALLSVIVLLAGRPAVAYAQTDCNTVPAGPARTDCYMGLSRIYGAQSDLAASGARVQSDAARYRQITGASRSKKKRREP